MSQATGPPITQPPTPSGCHCVPSSTLPGTITPPPSMGPGTPPGHPQRLNRPGIADFDHFGSGKYAREELIAQMPSSMLCAQTGTDTPEVFDESASYIVGWLHTLNDDTRAGAGPRGSGKPESPRQAGLLDQEGRR